jgi:hypothetical protein
MTRPSSSDEDAERDEPTGEGYNEEQVHLLLDELKAQMVRQLALRRDDLFRRFERLGVIHAHRSEGVVKMTGRECQIQSSFGLVTGNVERSFKLSTTALEWPRKTRRS